MFKSKLPQQEQGFTLVEVLVAILITTVFVSIAMQAIVIAASFKARAQELAETTTWIQEDLEDVKYKAANYQYTTLSSDADLQATSINVVSADDFKVNDKLKVGTERGTYTIIAKSGTSLTITPALATEDQFVGAVVAAIDRCKNSVLSAKTTAGANSINVASGDSFAIDDTLKVGLDDGTYTVQDISGTALTISEPLGTEQLGGSMVVISTPNAAFADGLRDKIIDPTGNTDLATITNYIEIPKTSDRTNKKFIMRKTTTIVDTAPYSILQVSYSVFPISGNPDNNSVAKLSTEVIPNAAFQCP